MPNVNHIANTSNCELDSSLAQLIQKIIDEDTSNIDLIECFNKCSWEWAIVGKPISNSLKDDFLQGFDQYNNHQYMFHMQETNELHVLIINAIIDFI